MLGMEGSAEAEREARKGLGTLPLSNRHEQRTHGDCERGMALIAEDFGVYMRHGTRARTRRCAGTCSRDRRTGPGPQGRAPKNVCDIEKTGDFRI